MILEGIAAAVLCIGATVSAVFVLLYFINGRAQ